MPPSDRGPSRATVAAFFAIVVIGSPVFVAVRFSNEALPPFWGAALRFGPAGLVFLALALALRLGMPRGRALMGNVIYGVLNFGASYAFAYWALVSIGASLAAVLVAIVPLLTFLLAALHRIEPFRWRPLAGGLVAVAGVAIIFGQQLSADVPLLALLAMLAAIVCIAETSVVVKLFPTSHPVTSNAVGMLIGFVILATISVLTKEARSLPPDPVTWLSLSYLTLVAGVVMFGLYVYVVRSWSASATAYIFVLTPLLAVPLATWLANETVTPIFAAGAALVLLGVYVGALSGSPARAAPAPATT